MDGMVNVESEEVLQGKFSDIETVADEVGENSNVVSGRGLTGIEVAE